ncbi:MAG: hypothetical protein F6K65_33755, partial [Moorea sp. SIO3C2]|nr:hypothetical protein [Moorena sp. SIO3C2]
MEDQDKQELANIISQQASNALAGANNFFKNLIKSADLPQKWKNELADPWTGQTDEDAHKLIKWAIDKGINEDNEKHTIVCILEILKEYLGEDDQNFVNKIINDYTYVGDITNEDEEEELDYQLPIKYQIPLVSITWLLLLSLPLSIFIEFKGFDSFELYAKLYPHLVLFPTIFLWSALCYLYKAFFLIKKENKRLLCHRIVVAVIFSIIVSFIELTSDGIMLFEIADSAIIVIPEVEVSEKILSNLSEIPEDVISPDHIIIRGQTIEIKKSDVENLLQEMILIEEDEHNDLITKDNLSFYQDLMQISLSPKIIKDITSFSRWSYALSFFIILTVFLTIVCFLLCIDFVSKEPKARSRYIRYLASAQIAYVFWIPMRIYYITKIKKLIFGDFE